MVNVGQDAGVGVALLRTSLVYSKIGKSSSVRRSIPRLTALTMMALTVLQDSRVSVHTACVVGQASSSFMTNPAIKVVTLGPGYGQLIDSDACLDPQCQLSAFKSPQPDFF